MTEASKWVFLDKLFCPSDRLVVADAKEVFGGSEDLGEEAKKRPWEDYESVLDKKAMVARVSPECLAINRIHPTQTLLDQGKWVLVYGRRQAGQLVELRILLDPFLDTFED